MAQQASGTQQEASAKRVFKFVAGVFNNAFPPSHSAKLASDIQVFQPTASNTPVFSVACDALMDAIEAGLVPRQGIHVIGDLLAKNSSSMHPDAILSTRLSAYFLPDTKASMVALSDVTSVGSEPACEAESGTDEKSGDDSVVDGNAFAPSLDDPPQPAAVETSGPDLEQAEPHLPEVQHNKLEPSAANKVFQYVTKTLTGIRLRPEQEAEIGELVVSVQQQHPYATVLLAAGEFLAQSISRGDVPVKGISVLLNIREQQVSEQVLAFFSESTSLLQALKPYLCPRCFEERPLSAVCDTCKDARKVVCEKCSGSGRFARQCHSCNGSGRFRLKKECSSCQGSGKKDLGVCNACKGGKTFPCKHCVSEPELGLPRPLCALCSRRVSEAARPMPTLQQRRDEVPTPGMTIERCSAGDLTRLRQLWQMRGGSGHVTDGWKVDNPLRAHIFRQRREQLKEILGREADGLEGFHGTHPDAVIPICEGGFDKSRRSGQVFGAGEYFAKNPSISIGYCRGGQYMLVCRLTLGVQSSSSENKDGDHIWVPSQGYYVIKEPEQVLPQYIIKFGNAHGACYARSNRLEDVLSQPKWSTKQQEAVRPVPKQRECCMANPFATVLWMGFLHAHISDETLEVDVRHFLTKNASDYVGGMSVQIVKGHFKKAHAILQKPIPRDLVHRLNRLPFVEHGNARTICVEDAHGSPGQKCPKFIAGYCRGQNLRFTQPCWCSHPPRPTERATYKLTSVPLESAKGVEILEKFMASGTFHNGSPHVVGIKAIDNQVLSKCHEEYRDYLKTKHMEEPAVQELYHGTNNSILDTLYKHGLQPPSDTQASEKCPHSGGKGLCTTLCNNDCKYCTQPHAWNKCHMYGLGIYLADLAQKSHRYVSQPRTGKGGRQTYRMVVCSVLGKSFQVEGHLKSASAMHDVVNVRSLTDDMMNDMVEQCQACYSWNGSTGVGASIQGINGDIWGRVVADLGHCWSLHTGRIAKKETQGYKWDWAAATDEVACDNLEVAEKSDLLFVKGLGSSVRPGFSVVNSEYIAFHPHQCLPKYEIEYELR